MVHSLLLVALALLEVPAGQGRQEFSAALPLVGLYVEGGQGVHWDAPGAEANVPAAQGWQEAEVTLPARELKVPAAHGLHAAAEVLPLGAP